MKFSTILLIIMLCVAGVATKFRYSSLVEENIKNSINVSELYSERIKGVLEQVSQSINILEKIIIKSNGIISEEELQHISDLVFDPQSYYAVLFSPAGIIDYAYPVKANAKLLGINLFEGLPSKADATLAMQHDSINFSGPYTLPTGVDGLVGRNPIYLDDNGEKVFWGFVSIVIKPLSGILKKSGILELNSFGFEYTVQSMYNGESVDLYKSPNFNPKDAISYSFNIFEGVWTIFLYSSSARERIYIYTGFIAFFYLFISLCIYLAFYKLEKQKKHVYQQSLIDPLTKLKNKKAVDLFAHSQKNFFEQGLSIFYIDLNKFKPVNDKYGHEMGDKLLKAFSKRLISNFSTDTFIARLGGDEFAVVFEENLEQNTSEQLKKRIVHLAEEPYYIDNTEISISASVGFAKIQENEKTFAEVLSRADEKMYENKENS